MGQLTSYTLELRTLPIGSQQFNYVVGNDFFALREMNVRRAIPIIAMLASRLTLPFDGYVAVGIGISRQRVAMVILKLIFLLFKGAYIRNFVGSRQNLLPTLVQMAMLSVAWLWANPQRKCMI